MSTAPSRSSRSLWNVRPRESLYLDHPMEQSLLLDLLQFVDVSPASCSTAELHPVELQDMHKMGKNREAMFNIECKWFVLTSLK